MASRSASVLVRLGLGGAAALAVAVPNVAANAAAPSGLFPGYEPMDIASLRHMRGGLRIGDFNIDFAITVTSAVENVGLQTTFTLNPEGKLDAASQVLDQMPDVPNGSGFQVNVSQGDGDPAPASAGSTAGSAASNYFRFEFGPDGATLRSADGSVVISHIATPRGIDSAISNQMNDATVISDVQFNVMVSDFADKAALYSQLRNLSLIGEEVGRMAAGLK